MNDVETFNTPDSLVPAHGQVSFAITEGELESSDPDDAAKVLRELAHGLKVAASATIRYRILLGHQLLIIQEKGLWKRMLVEGRGRPGHFNTWLQEHFSEIAETGRDTAYNAMKLAHSLALGKADDADVRRIGNLTNAYTLVIAERRGVEITKEVLRQAASMSVMDFKDELLKESGPVRGRVGAVTDTPGQARFLTEIIAQLKGGDYRALRAFSTAIREVWPLAGNNPTDVLDFITAAVSHEVSSFMESDREALKTVDIDFDEVDSAEGSDPADRIEP